MSALPVRSRLRIAALAVVLASMGSAVVMIPAEAATSSPVAETPTMRNLTRPTIAGTPMMGYTLGLHTGTWSPGGGTYAYQWSANGVQIADATASTFTLTPAQVGKQMSVRVTASKTGYQSSSMTSEVTAAVQPGMVTNSVLPSIYGAQRVGATVGVNAGVWSPSSVVWTYRWFADGALIPGATTKTFVPGAALFGRSLQAEVTGSRDGYISRTALSAASTPLTCSLVPPTELAKASVAKTTITLSWTKAACATSYVLTYGKSTSSARVSRTVGDVAQLTLTGLTKGTTYKVSIASVRRDGVRSADSSTVSVSTAK